MMEQNGKYLYKLKPHARYMKQLASKNDKEITINKCHGQKDIFTNVHLQERMRTIFFHHNILPPSQKQNITKNQINQSAPAFKQCIATQKQENSRSQKQKEKKKEQHMVTNTLLPLKVHVGIIYSHKAYKTNMSIIFY